LLIDGFLFAIMEGLYSLLKRGRGGKYEAEVCWVYNKSDAED